MLQVRELETAQSHAWDEMVSRSPQGNSFLRSEWLQMLCHTDPDLHVQLLGVFDRERLVGGQPVLWHARWQVPLATKFEFFYGGPLLAESPRAGSPAFAPVQNKILELLAHELAQRLDLIEFETSPRLPDVRSYLEARWNVQPVYTHLWHIDSLEKTWAEMNGEKRREIKRARGEFVFSRDDSDAALDAWLPLYRKTMEKFFWYPSPHWGNIFRKRFAWLRERDGAHLYVAHNQAGELCGGVVTLHSREDKTVYLFKQGSDPNARDLGMIPALYWHVAQDVAADFPWIDFGGSPFLSLSHFKDYLGAHATVHFQVSYQKPSFRLALYQAAYRAKNQVYVKLMRPAHGVFQTWYYKTVRREYAS